MRMTDMHWGKMLTLKLYLILLLDVEQHLILPIYVRQHLILLLEDISRHIE